MLSNDISDVLTQRAVQNPEKTAFIFLKNGEVEQEQLTYQSLHHRALVISAYLQQHLDRKKPVLLIYPSGADYVCAFWACLYAGIIAVPTHLPRRNREDSRLESIAIDAQATYILTTNELAESILPSLKNCPTLQTLPILCTDQDFPLVDELSNAYAPDQLAFLQYTSGSTGTPKGVMISRGNLLHNAHYVHHKADLQNSPATVTWLPGFHDMGLMNGLILPIISDMLCVMMTPTAFLQQPLRWLKAVSKYRAGFSGGPNFAYDLCVQRANPEELTALDLSQWRCAFNAAEPVRADTLQQFIETFADSGFQADGFFPCYGLAENTVAVTGGLVYQPTPPRTLQVSAEAMEQGHMRLAINGERSTVFSGCGHTNLDVQLNIVDPHSLKILPETQVGEIWIAGSSVAQGYWNQPELSQAIFNAHLQDGQGGFLRSGDLGFIQDGQLYVTGRLKDLIIIRGRNHYPQDIELTVERSHPALAPSSGAAFSIQQGNNESLIIVQEVQRAQVRRLDAEAVFQAICQTVTQQHEVVVEAIVLLKPGQLPKTSSGKVRRNQCRQDYLNDNLAALAQWNGQQQTTSTQKTAEPSTPTEQRLITILQTALEPKDSIWDKHTNFAALGLDSLHFIHFHNTLQGQLQQSISLDDMMACDNLTELAQYLDQHQYQFSSQTIHNNPPKAPLLPQYPATQEQRRYWHLQQARKTAATLLIPAQVTINQVLDKTMLQRALATLIARHHMLRAAFDLQGNLCIQEHIPAVFSDDNQETWDMTQAPLWRLSLQQTDSQTILSLSIHHSIADLWSVQVFFKELSALYGAWVKAQVNPLESLHAQFEDYAYAEQQTTVSSQQLAYWEQLPYACFEPLKLPYKPNFQHSGKQLAASAYIDIPQATHQQLQIYCQQHQLTVTTVYLAVLRLLLFAYAEQEHTVIGLTLFNRHHSAWQKLIGCFAQVSYLHIPAHPQTPIDQFIQQVAQAVQQLRQNGLSLEQTADKLLAHRAGTQIPALQIMFNYMPLDKELDSLFGGHSTFAAAHRDDIDFDMAWTGIESSQGCRWSVEYVRDGFDTETIELLLKQFSNLLQAVCEKQLPTIGDIQTHLGMSARKQLVIGATFSADSVGGVVKSWLDQFEARYDIQFVDFNQILQALADPYSLFHRNHHGINVILLRLQDWAVNPQAVEEFLQLLQQATHQTHSQYLLILCPEPEHNPDLEVQRQHIQQIANRFPQCHVIDGKQISAQYRLKNIHDPIADAAAALPYRPHFFAGLGNTISRFAFQAWHPKFKLIALDGDNTLWQGVVAEQGIHGVKVHRQFQEKLLTLKNSGALLALLSKNIESDVAELFAQRGDFPLKREDFVTWEVNWQPKSQNLQNLAEQLNLDIGHFLFIDDNPVEIAEVSTACPTVATLQFSSDEIERFVEHIWWLDPPLQTSTEDRRRTQMYVENSQRQQAQQQAGSFQAFLDTLNLNIRITPIKEAQIERVSQLSQRVNQFNATTWRCSIADVQAIHADPNQTLLTVEVSDRFGDYGLTGAAFLVNEDDAIRVKNLLLSCRVLGRGVEDKLLRHIGQFALEQGCNSVLLDFTATARNQPIHHLYQSLDGFASPTHQIDAQYLATWQRQASEAVNKPTASKQKTSSNSIFQRQIDTQALANLWLATSQIDEQSFPTPRQKNDSAENIIPPKTANEMLVLQIWQDILKQETISTTINFTEAGGTSIDMVRLLSALCERTGITFSYAFVLENSSIQMMASALDYHEKTGRLPDITPFPQRQDAVLSEALRQQIIQANAAKSAEQTPTQVLLTGATGYLGAYLLYELLQQTTFQVHCLVRAASESAGLARLRNNLQQYNLWQTGFEARIHILIGDFSQPNFALSPKQYIDLSQQISHIYHNGAQVDFSVPYAILKPANVDGTCQVLDFASCGCRKTLHYVSTASVFDTANTQPQQQQFETPLSADSYAVFGGYAQSKWAAERLVSQATDLGLSVNIFRPNGIGPAVQINHSRFNESDAFGIILLASINLGKFFDLPLNVDFAPVDYVAATLVKLSLNTDSDNHIYSLTNPKPQSLSTISKYLQKLGETAELLPYQDWLTEIEAYAQRTAHQGLLGLLPLLNQPLTNNGLSWLEMSAQRPYFDCSNTLQGLGNTEIRCRNIDIQSIMELLLLAYVTHNYQQVNGVVKTEQPESHGEDKQHGILILSWSLGEGHNVQSAALKQQLQQHGTMPVEIVQLGEWMSLVARLEGFWRHLAAHDIGLLNQYMQLTQSCQQHELATFHKIYQHTAARLFEQFKPRQVVALCPAGAQLLRYFKQNSPQLSTVTGITDWFGGDFKEWTDEGADWIYSPSQQCSDYLKITNPKTPSIKTGSPIMSAFFNQAHLPNRQQALQKLGLSAETRLMLFNTYGDPTSLELLQAIDDVDCHIVVLCYRDDATEQAALQLKMRATLHVKAWLSDMPTWLAAAQTVFSKPGSGICAEAIHLGVVPLLNSQYGIMRQEQSVHSTLLNENLALDIDSSEAFQRAVQQWLNNGSGFTGIQHNIEQYSLHSGTKELAKLLWEAMSRI
ncbi:thioester reductase domain-containing protein [Candidatus Albibeggiatoa sp. nov. NOAA]|uniref:thioester reductase domain-containing protein n=1 Tax=Candidatus Albibeggiatoa sp. nov. NOAA TaxID=3162724 RepID=UPI0032FA69AF|nr:thioester reductase domain-containing protein [Thiotrichaceae bacterium]